MKAFKKTALLFAIAMLTLNNAKANSYDINGTPVRKGANLVGVITDSSTGKGIGGIPVSDGFSYAFTDANGVYQMTADPHCRFVSYSAPAEYKIALNAKGNVSFYSTVSFETGAISRRDFVLERLDKDENDFTILAISDPQCKYSWHKERYVNETIPDMQNSINEAQANGKYRNIYAVTLGDETYDNHDLFPEMRKAETGIKIKGDYGVLPVFDAIGNHDHDYNFADNDFNSTALYCKWFGPTDYSFNRGKAHIVVMDDVLACGAGKNTCKYDAGFTDEQMKWFQEDIATVKDPENTLLIFCTHIPFKGGEKTGGDAVNFDKNYDVILRLMTRFHEAHLLIGHTHCPENYIHEDYVCAGGQPIYEHIHAAVCGGWWYSNLCIDGSPNGYAFYEIQGDSVRDWVAKGTGLDYDFQMRVYDGNDIYAGDVKTFGWEPEFKGCFIASVFNDDDEYWKLNLVCDGKTYPMKRVEQGQVDWCAYSFHINVCHRLLSNASWHPRKKHYWTVEAPGGDPAAIKDWKIVARQVIPSSGAVHEYECNKMQRDFEGFAMYSDGTRK